MRKLVLIVALAALLVSGLPGAVAGPTQGGVTSDNVEWIDQVEFEVGTATGMKVIGKYLYITSWKTFSIYDISDPLGPELLSQTPFGFKFENEDVATNGDILLFSEQLPQNVLHVWDVEDKTNPVEIATLPGGGGHTSDCILDCKYSYSSTGVIVDLREPTKPKIVGNWGKGMPATSAHDVNEVAPGMVLTSSEPITLLDARKNPAKPKLVAVGKTEDVPGGVHSNQWPLNMKSRYALFSSETNGKPRCDEASGSFMTWDTKNYRKGLLELVDVFQVQNGTAMDGSPISNGLGCSAHWFEVHPDYAKNGIVAGGFYEHGTRFTQISSAGKIKEIGYFMPWAGSTSASYWVTKDIVYAVDYSRGIDILKVNLKK